MTLPAGRVTALRFSCWPFSGSEGTWTWINYFHAVSSEVRHQGHVATLRKPHCRRERMSSRGRHRNGEGGASWESESAHLLVAIQLQFDCASRRMRQRNWLSWPPALKRSFGYGPKLSNRGTAGFSPCFHLPGFRFLTHSHLGWLLADLKLCILCKAREPPPHLQSANRNEE